MFGRCACTLDGGDRQFGWVLEAGDRFLAYDERHIPYWEYNVSRAHHFLNSAAALKEAEKYPGASLWLNWTRTR